MKYSLQDVVKVSRIMQGGPISAPTDHFDRRDRNFRSIF